MPRIVDLAAQHRLPALYDVRHFVDAGGLVSHGPDLRGMCRRSAGYADRVLRGAKPGDPPVEQPAKFEMVINLKTAKSPGIAIPRAVKELATEVIE